MGDARVFTVQQCRDVSGTLQFHALRTILRLASYPSELAHPELNVIKTYNERTENENYRGGVRRFYVHGFVRMPIRKAGATFRW
jgi:hypothetical protein